MSEETQIKWRRLIVGCFAVDELRTAEYVFRYCKESAVASSIKGFIDQLLCSTSGGSKTLSDLKEHLKFAAKAYLKFKCVHVARSIDNIFSRHVVKEAGRRMRDVVTWRCFSLVGFDSVERALDAMDIAFGGAFRNGDDELKSQMVQSLNKEFIALGLQPRCNLGRWKTKLRKGNVTCSGLSAPSTSWAGYSDAPWPVNPWSCVDPFALNPVLFSPFAVPLESHLMPQLYSQNVGNFTPTSFGDCFHPDLNTTGFHPDLNTAVGEASAASHTGGHSENPTAADSEHAEDFRNESKQQPEDCEDNASLKTLSVYPEYEPEQRGRSHHKKNCVQPEDCEDNASLKTLSVYPEYDPEQRGRSHAKLPSIQDDEDQDAGEKLDGQLPLSTCEQCGVESSTGHSNRQGHHYCRDCWATFLLKAYPQDNGEKGEPCKQHAATFKRYETMEPIRCKKVVQTHVQVVDVCCLKAARLAPSSCIVALQKAIRVDNQEQAVSSWPLRALWERTSFREAFHEGVDMKEKITPPQGGFYVHKVTVHKDEFGISIGDVAVPAVFGSTPWKSENEKNFEDEMRTKIRNLLRICRCHGHEEIIIASTFDRLPARQVAALFREELDCSNDSGEAFNFRRVSFALPLDEVKATVFMAFQQEFSPEDPHRSLWKQGQFLAPKDLQALCLNVDMHPVKMGNIRGVKASMFKPSSFARREQQHWYCLPCGRIVLAAFPQLCLSAKFKGDGADVHIWSKVETKTQELQIWSLNEDGSIVLKSAPHMYLSFEEGTSGCAVKLRKSSGTKHMWDWHYYMEHGEATTQLPVGERSSILPPHQSTAQLRSGERSLDFFRRLPSVGTWYADSPLQKEA